MTIPSIALFGLLIPILSLIGQGIGYLPAVIALMLYSQLPIIRNTYTAIMNVDPALREAARGMGMTTDAAAAPGRAADRAAGDHHRRAQRGGAQHRASPRSRPTSAPAGSAPSSRAASRRPTSASSSPARSRSACSRSSPIFALLRRLQRAADACARASARARHDPARGADQGRSAPLHASRRPRRHGGARRARSACCSARPAAARRRR